LGFERRIEMEWRREGEYIKLKGVVLILINRQREGEGEGVVKGMDGEFIGQALHRVRMNLVGGGRDEMDGLCTLWRERGDRMVA
jgi:hypothetical protein